MVPSPFEVELCRGMWANAYTSCRPSASTHVSKKPVPRPANRASDVFAMGRPSRSPRNSPTHTHELVAGSSAARQTSVLFGLPGLIRAALSSREAKTAGTRKGSRPARQRNAGESTVCSRRNSPTPKLPARLRWTYARAPRSSEAATRSTSRRIAGEAPSRSPSATTAPPGTVSVATTERSSGSTATSRRASSFGSRRNCREGTGTSR
mmetsp:Transcript_18463/g.45319  ORF Transcript_18463/g.45319 Transcript_18463/m.45319 type:complete len:208 (-) Transcript_18463:1246-1869(-)